MKITLHDSIPSARRPEVECLVKKHAGDCRVFWMPSRFPRLVMLVDPEGSYEPGADGGSFFEPSDPGEYSIAALTEMLEMKIKDYLAAGAPS